MADWGQRDAAIQPYETAENKPWDRLAKESKQAFDAFVIFRGLPGNRLLTDVAKQLNCSVPNISRWAKKNLWYQRVRQWDIHQDQIAQEEDIRERIAMRKRQANQGVAMQSLAAHGLKALLDRYGTAEKLGAKLPDLEPGDITRLFEVGSKMERLARGEELNGPAQIIVHLGDVDEEAIADGEA